MTTPAFSEGIATGDWRSMLLILTTLAGRVLLSATFIHAGIQKIRHRAQLPGVIANYKLLPTTLVPLVSWLLPPAELLTGIALLTPTSVSALTAGCMLLLFTAAIATNIFRGRIHIDCGCFQPELRQELSWDLVLRNAALIAIAAYAASFPALPPPLIYIPAALFGLVSYVLYHALAALFANRSALRSLATPAALSAGLRSPPAPAAMPNAPRWSPNQAPVPTALRSPPINPTTASAPPPPPAR